MKAHGKSVSAAQREQLLFTEAKEDKEMRQDLANSLQESSAIFDTALQNVSSSTHDFGESIWIKSITATEEPSHSRSKCTLQCTE